MSIKTWVFCVISGVLSVIMLTLTVLMCIPSTQKLIADRIAINLSPAYAEVKNDNANKDSLIDTQKIQLKECTTNINLLKNDKTVLLDSLSEIDNKINSTTDKVELDNLNARKTAILDKIQELDNKIKTLEADKQELRKRINELENSSSKVQYEVESTSYTITLGKGSGSFPFEKDVVNEATLLDVSDIVKAYGENYIQWLEKTVNFTLSTDDFKEMSLNNSFTYLTLNELAEKEDNGFDVSNYQKACLKIKLFDVNGIEFNISDNMKVLSNQYNITFDFDMELYTLEEIEALYPNFSQEFEFKEQYIKSFILKINVTDFDSTADVPTPVEYKWSLNDTLTAPESAFSDDIIFKSNNTIFKGIGVSTEHVEFGLSLAYSEVYVFETNTYSNTDFKNITFYAEPTGELLAWLQTNATQVID